MAITISRPRDSEMCPLGKRLSDERVCIDISESNVGTRKIFYPENLLHLYWNNSSVSYPYPPINAVRDEKNNFPAHHNIDPVIHFWLDYWKSQGVTFPEELDPLHIKVIIAKESSFDQNEESPLKATGLMQIMEDSLKALADTERTFGNVPNNYVKKASLEDLKDPVVNVAIGIRWLGQKHYLLRNRSDEEKGLKATIGAYFGGTDKVRNDYAERIFKAYDLSK